MRLPEKPPGEGEVGSLGPTKQDGVSLIFDLGEKDERH